MDAGVPNRVLGDVGHQRAALARDLEWGRGKPLSGQREPLLCFRGGRVTSNGAEADRGLVWLCLHFGFARAFVRAARARGGRRARTFFHSIRYDAVLRRVALTAARIRQSSPPRAQRP